MRGARARGAGHQIARRTGRSRRVVVVVVSHRDRTADGHVANVGHLVAVVDDIADSIIASHISRLVNGQCRVLDHGYIVGIFCRQRLIRISSTHIVDIARIRISLCDRIVNRQDTGLQRRQRISTDRVRAVTGELAR